MDSIAIVSPLLFTLMPALIGHLVGDYILQNDWMAANKKTDWEPCFVHSLIWSLCVMTFGGWWGATGYEFAFILLFCTHFLQDFTHCISWWMNHISGQQRFAQPPLAPWSLIVVDNVFHVLVVFGVWKWLCALA